MAKITKYLSCISFFLFVSCMTQSPAPVEFRDTKSLNDANFNQVNDTKQQVISEPMNDLPSDQTGLDKYQDVKFSASQPQEGVDEVAILHKKQESQETNSAVKEGDLESELASILDDKQNKKLDTANSKILQNDKLDANQQGDPNHEDDIGKTNLSLQQKSLSKLGLNLIKPVEGRVIKSFSNANQGINISAPLGSQVKAVYDGEVVYAGYDDRFGNLLIIKLKDSDLFAAHAHLDELILIKGAKVTQGSAIGYVGQTGAIDHPQLYFAIKKGKAAIDPAIYLPY